MLIGCVQNASREFWSVRCSCFLSCSSGRTRTLPTKTRTSFRLFFVCRFYVFHQRAAHENHFPWRKCRFYVFSVQADEFACRTSFCGQQPVHSLRNPTGEGVICFTSKPRARRYSHFFEILVAAMTKSSFLRCFSLFRLQVAFLFPLLSLTPFCLFHNTQRVRRNYGKYTFQLFLGLIVISCYFCLVVFAFYL